jgi:ABC-type transport system involved in multi-copper enzyme maturation permease subunit
MPQDDTRYNDEPVFAVFRFLDLEFIFQIVLSLFAILFAYDAVNGEKERGTLQLTLANPVPRRAVLTGKLLGAFCALGIPLLIPILLGSLLLIALGMPMRPDEWLRLALIVVAGLLYFGVFLTLSVTISALTRRSAHSFLMLLVIWILSVLVIPRSAVLIAGRAVEVPTVDEIGAKMARLSHQVWTEDREKMSAFKPSTTDDPRKAMEEFQKLMGKIGDDREKKMSDLSSRLNEERANRQATQQAVAFGIARISPSACFALAASALSGSGLALQEHYRSEARAYQQTYAKFILDKTGVNPGGGMMFRVVTNGEKPKPIDPKELPPFEYHPLTLAELVSSAVLDLGLLAVFCLVLFGAAHAAFVRYDIR